MNPGDMVLRLVRFHDVIYSKTTTELKGLSRWGLLFSSWGQRISSLALQPPAFWLWVSQQRDAQNIK